MINLTPANAVTQVRKNLDEMDANGSSMILYVDETGDNASLDDIIKRNIPEAVNAICLAAPVPLLEGIDQQVSDDDTYAQVTVANNGVVEIRMPNTADFLRLVAFQAEDSPFVVTEVLPEASIEARKQQNPHLRGTFDRPRLVLMQGTGGAPVLRYYTVRDASEYSEDPTDAVKQFKYIKRAEYSNTVGTTYPVPEALLQNVIDYLTALVMTTYKDDRAQIYIQKAKQF